MSVDRTDHEMTSCPCCRSKALTTSGQYEICEVCGWEDDPAQAADPRLKGGANHTSLEQARLDWAAKSVPDGKGEI